MTNDAIDGLIADVRTATATIKGLIEERESLRTQLKLADSIIAVLEAKVKYLHKRAYPAFEKPKHWFEANSTGFGPETISDEGAI
jgi:hypothetical protein